MKSQQIKDLEIELWGVANLLRVNSRLTAAEYKDPVLGLILLRFAQNKFEEAEQQLDLPVNPRTGDTRAATKDDFKASNVLFLPGPSNKIVLF